MQMKSVFETKMQRQHELSEVMPRKILSVIYSTYMTKKMLVLFCINPFVFFSLKVYAELFQPFVFSKTSYICLNLRGMYMF